MRKWLAITVLSAIFTFVAALFWFNEWRYSLPTPVPENYHAVEKGAFINLTAKFTAEKNSPVFLHFFNPDCPCSRFNITHFKSLAARYGNSINFAVIVMTKNKNYTAGKIREKYGLTMPVLSDTSLAGICGVYSTPQAVLLDNHHRLYYRGNYNSSRYCTDNKTNYARIAIDSLLSCNERPLFDRLALTAYGCSLPGCSK